ncbi:methyl-accepting chemotaxis protein [Sinorhizobium meliloti]|uniref:methyl-accepting chemotaxis protein n=1 Tax=Rhizobium meliloti TaxID=382 RepID=UPI00398D4315
MKIGLKLNLSFYIIIGLMVLMTIVVLLNLTSIDEKQKNALDYRVEQILIVKNIRESLAFQGSYSRALILEDSKENRNQLDLYSKKIDENITLLNQLVSSDLMKDLVSKMNEYNEGFRKGADDLLISLDSDDDIRASAKIVNTELNEANVGLLAVADKMIEYEDGQLALIRKETDDAVSFTKIVSIVSVVVSVVIGISLIIWIRKAIINPLGHLMNAAEFIADGDLTQQDIKITSKDEIGQLGMIFNKMKGNLEQLIQSVQFNAQQLVSTSKELSASTEEIATTTEDVTKQLELNSDASQASVVASNESARAMEETAWGVQRIAESSQVLHNSAIDASRTAKNGVGAIEEVKLQMAAINDSTVTVNELVVRLAQQTMEIENMTKVITDITEQTNLLSLNAAIEAARAGEHGKGFAVVADEVRKLAENSKQSANSIVELTLEIQRDTVNVEQAVSSALSSVKEGVNIIGNAGKSFDEIVGAVGVITNNIEEISATAEQLSASAEEVSASANEIAIGAESASQSVDSIAAAMEEQSATMQEVSGIATLLVDSATELQNEIGKFKVANTDVYEV